MAIATAYATQVVRYLGGGGAPTAISAIYLDLYDGDPTDGGASVLSTLTGSATRTNVTSSFTAASAVLSNTSLITITSAADATASVVFVAFFDAATSGNLVMYETLVNPQTVTMFNGCSFPIGSINVQLIAGS